MTSWSVIEAATCIFGERRYLFEVPTMFWCFAMSLRRLETLAQWYTMCKRFKRIRFWVRRCLVHCRWYTRRCHVRTRLTVESGPIRSREVGLVTWRP